MKTMPKRSRGGNRISNELQQMMRWGERQEILQLLIRMAKSGEVEAMRLFFELTGDLGSARAAAIHKSPSRGAPPKREERWRDSENVTPDGALRAAEPGAIHPGRKAFHIRSGRDSISGDKPGPQSGG